MSALNLAFIIFVNFAVFVLILTSKLAVPLLDYCNLQYYNLPQSRIKSLQNMQNSLDQSLLTSLLFLNLYTGSK